MSHLHTTGKAAAHVARNAVRENWAEVDGARTRFLQCDSRAENVTPILLIHGLLGYSFSWRCNIEALAQFAPVYAIDLPGVGFSERCRDMDCSARGIAKCVLRFMDVVGIDSADIVGTSHGGMIAMFLAALAPGRVRRMVLAAPVNPWSTHGLWLTRFLAKAVAGSMLQTLAPCLSVLNGTILHRMYGDPRRIPSGTLDGYAAPIRVPGTFSHLRRITRTWHADLSELKRVIQQVAHFPTLLVWGTLDRAVLPESAGLLRQQFKNAQLVMLDGIGHLPYEESPEQFNQVVRDFLTEHRV